MAKNQIHYQLLVKTSDCEITLDVTKKVMKRIIFRYDPQTTHFRVSAPTYTTKSEILKLFKEKETLIMKLMDKKPPQALEPLYYYGNPYPSYQEMLDNPLASDLASFYRLAKVEFLSYLTKRTRELEKVMAIPLAHKVRLRLMKTRWGTNSLKTRTITYNLRLIHYHPDIIDAIIIHELAHYYLGGHGKNFYQLVGKYCPNYPLLSRNLKRSHYANH